jgi:hypothetical protein
MGLHTGMRVKESDRKGTVLKVTSNGTAKVGWDDGAAGHRPLTALTVLGKDVGNKLKRCECGRESNGLSAHTRHRNGCEVAQAGITAMEAAFEAGKSVAEARAAQAEAVAQAAAR